MLVTFSPIAANGMNQNNSDTIVQTIDTVTVDTVTVQRDSVCENKTDDWNMFVKAIAFVESGYRERAISKGGGSVGYLQITKVCVRECNNILRRNGSRKKYTYNDRYNKNKSIEMFNIYQNKFNPNHNLEKAARIWNGGPGYKTKSTNNYWKKVYAKYKKLKSNSI